MIHRRLKLIYQPKNRQGSMLVMVAVCMVIFLIAAVFCVDIAYMHMVKAELRTATDAAAKAGAEALARTQDPDQAVNAAIAVAEENLVARDGLTLNASNIELGTTNQLADGTIQFQVGGADLTAVRVVGARDEGSPDGNVRLFLGGLMGTEFFSPTQDASASSTVRDIALVLDRSGSMNARVGGGTRLSALISAVNVFLNEIEDSSPNSNISLTTYATTSTRDLPLSSNFGPIRGQVNSLRARGATNIFQALRQGSDSLEQDAQRRRFADQTIVLMTDGNFNVGGPPFSSARVAASRDHTIHTITFSGGANQPAMRQVADIGGGIHVHADSAGDLSEAFREIARTISVVLID